MAISMRKNEEGLPQTPLSKPASRDITEIAVRMLIGLLMNYITKRLRKSRSKAQNRKEAVRKIAKLEKKGKEVPEDLQKAAVEGLGHHQKKKLAKADARKAAKGKKAKKARKGKKKKHRLVWLVIIAAAIAVAVKAAGKKQ